MVRCDVQRGYAIPQFRCMGFEHVAIIRLDLVSTCTLELMFFSYNHVDAGFDHGALLCAAFLCDSAASLHECLYYFC